MTDIQHPNTKEFLHTPKTVLTSLMFSIITGVVIWLMVWVIANSFTAILYPESFANVASVIAFGATWLLLLYHWFGLTSIEKFLNVDINNDGRIGDEEEDRREPKIIRIQLDEVKPNGHIGNTKLFDLPVESEHQLVTFATAVLNGMPISERYWAKDNKLFSTDGYRAFRDALRARGLIDLVNPGNNKHGFKLTDEGRTVMTKIVEQYSPSPTPSVQAA